MRTRLAALSFTAAIPASVLVPAFGGTAQAHPLGNCIGVHVVDELSHHDSLQQAVEGHLGDHGIDDPHVEGGAHPVTEDIASFFGGLRFHCGL